MQTNVYFLKTSHVVYHGPNAPAYIDLGSSGDITDDGTGIE